MLAESEIIQQTQERTGDNQGEPEITAQNKKGKPIYRVKLGINLGYIWDKLQKTRGLVKRGAIHTPHIWVL